MSRNLTSPLTISPLNASESTNYPDALYVSTKTIKDEIKVDAEIYTPPDNIVYVDDSDDNSIIVNLDSDQFNIPKTEENKSRIETPIYEDKDNIETARASSALEDRDYVDDEEYSLSPGGINEYNNQQSNDNESCDSDSSEDLLARIRSSFYISPTMDDYKNNDDNEEELYDITPTLDESIFTDNTSPIDIWPIRFDAVCLLNDINLDIGNIESLNDSHAGVESTEYFVHNNIYNNNDLLPTIVEEVETVVTFKRTVRINFVDNYIKNDLDSGSSEELNSDQDNKIKYVTTPREHKPLPWISENASVEMRIETVNPLLDSKSKDTEQLPPIISPITSSPFSFVISNRFTAQDFPFAQGHMPSISSFDKGSEVIGSSQIQSSFSPEE